MAFRITDITVWKIILLVVLIILLVILVQKLVFFSDTMEIMDAVNTAPKF
ncbi:hypothetical protein HYU13_05010 [Candidatus Woesearchaeota archaeon]|nr:hypothetical protein [Candidatus Woesearchaeota archaeon]